MESERWYLGPPALILLRWGPLEKGVPLWGNVTVAEVLGSAGSQSHAGWGEVGRHPQAGRESWLANSPKFSDHVSLQAVWPAWQMKPAVSGTREGHQSHSSGHHRTLFRNVCGSLDGPKASLSRLRENRCSIKGNEPPGDREPWVLLTCCPLSRFGPLP